MITYPMLNCYPERMYETSSWLKNLSMMGQGIERVRNVVKIQAGLEKLSNGTYVGSSQRAPYKVTRIKTSSPRVRA